jgi:hypothetical protein
MVLKMNASQVLEHIYLNNMILAAAGDGVISGLDVSEKGAGANMSVDVATGSTLIGGTTYTESSIVNLVIEAAHATLHRKDLITYDPTTSNPVVTKGTNHAGGTADPIYPPNIPTGDILLAVIEVAATATTITNGEITDCIVEVVTGGSLDGLSNVLISAITNNEVLAWDTSSSKWINQTPAEAALATLAGFTMAGDINMGDNNFTGVNEFRAYDLNGIDFDNNSGTRRIRLALTNYSFSADAPADMGSNKIGSVADPTAAQDAATKNWVENTAVIDAAKVDGCDAGLSTADVWKIPAHAAGVLYQHSGTAIVGLPTGTSGYQLTTRGSGLTAVWAASSDLIFSDTHCPKCEQEFKDGDDLILHVIGHNEAGDILTIPMHLSCANEPKKTVMVQRKVMEDHFIIDEETGELVVQKVQKTQKKTVTRRKLKEGYALNNITGKAHTIDDKDKHGEALPHLADAIEETEETIEEPVYEDVLYQL